MGQIHVNNKDILKVIKKAEQQGWQVVPTKNGHMKWYAPDGKSIVTSPSTGSYRSWKNFLAMIRKAGYKD
jgi:predicted RNA binding protein YcfA (HicA-like mRNA interferase family)